MDSASHMPSHATSDVRRRIPTAINSPATLKIQTLNSHTYKKPISHIYPLKPTTKPKMSDHQSFSYSTSYTSTSTSTGAQPQTTAYAERTYSSQGPGSAGTTTTERISKEPGRAAVRESFTTGPDGKTRAVGAIEDVTDAEAERLYEERIEEEYAKREGGA